MKVPSIKGSIKNITEKLKTMKYEKHQKEIENLVRIHPEKAAETDAFKQIYDAREVLANYAKANDIYMSFIAYSPKGNAKNIIVSVYGKNTLPLNQKVSLDTSVIYPKEKYTKHILEDKDGLNNIRETRNSTEDNFLRHIYRTVEELTKQIKK